MNGNLLKILVLLELIFEKELLVPSKLAVGRLLI